MGDEVDDVNVDALIRIVELLAFLRSGVPGLGFRVQGLGFGIWGFWFRVSGSGFGV